MQSEFKELTENLLALPAAQRAVLAQALWSSLDDSEPRISEDETLNEAERRDQEMKIGTVTGRTHAEVMASLRSRLK